MTSNVCDADQAITKTEPANKSTSSADQIRSPLRDHRSDIDDPNTDCNERYEKYLCKVFFALELCKFSKKCLLQGSAIECWAF